MARKFYDKEIDKNTDWGGDPSTEDLPVSGGRVQEFIRNTLSKKMGIFYYETQSNRYLCFADEQDRDSYIANPTQTELVLGVFDAPFNFTAEINLVTPIYNAVFLNSIGNYITFTYDIKNKQGGSTGEDVLVTYTIIRNTVKKIITETKKYGDIINFNIDEFLNEGVTSISIGIKGIESFASTIVNTTYQVVNLQLSDELDITNVYDLRETVKIAEIPFSVSGYGTKIVEWYLDGDLVEYDRNVDEAVDVSVNRVKYITLNNLNHGVHSLQIRAYTIVNGERFYSDTLYRNLFINASNIDKNVMIGVSGTIPQIYGKIEKGNPYKIYGMVQFLPYNLVFATYSPTSVASTSVEVFLDGDVIGNVNSKNDVVNRISIVPNTSGTKSLKLKAGSIETILETTIEGTTMDIQEITSGLVMDFSSSGRTNNSFNRDIWEQNGLSATFNNFNWNNTSGWVDDRLLVSNGASLEISYAPLNGDVVALGKTIEIEFMTTSVSDGDTVICDLRNASGVGILITANKISMKSQNGVEISTHFNSEENVRLSLVINRKSGSSNKMLSFLYANGILSSARNWIDTDNYTSDKIIKFVGSESAQVSIKQIRVYNEALSSNQILNNYILYRNRVVDMISVYDRNDIYLPGTNTFSPEKMASRVPVMIVTGNIPVLENTGNKNEQIIVDIEYINMQEPTTSFKMVNAAMRPQGTSSMAYPKKNFRIYTQKVDSTIVYDYQGEIIEDKLYSFKPNAQPVNCWCLKADYAESSGTHNTGLARLWNEVLYNTQLQVTGSADRFVLRTEAQKAAILNGYQYDVRTTIDGFPILVFYRLSPNDDLIFIGKYNFNNDKSTEAVFGFKDIPGFDNSNMQCWEVRDNGHPLGLFTDITNFDTQWSDAWESRYPDSKTPATLPDLKRFSQWVFDVKDDPERFATEKWDRLNVYNTAAYYVYLMRFGAVDQVVKNVFLTSEDGEKYYFINYDNDTILGLLNSGQLEGEPTITRNTTTESGEYVYAGRNSVLWNLLEADTEFMSIVPEIDNAMNTHGLSYNAVIELFDNKQADYWVERVYNQDAQYKYIGTFVENKANNLFMLQGKRDLHRKWWLSKRFSIYDAKWISGSYRAFSIDLKCLNDTIPGQRMKIVAGENISFGYGLNSALRVNGIDLLVNEEYTFITTDTLNRGDVVRLFGAPNIKELDLSHMADRLLNIELAGAVSPAIGTKLERAIFGRLGANNLECTAIAGLKNCVRLKELNVEGFKGLTSLDLRGLLNIEVVKARNSNIAAIALDKGVPINKLELPDSVNTVILEQLPYLTISNLIFGNSVKDIKIIDSPNLSSGFNFLYNWYNTKTNLDRDCSFEMDTINWLNVDPAQFIEVLQLKEEGVLILKGNIDITEISVEIVNSLRSLLGVNIFEEDGELYITAPDFIDFTTTNLIQEGEEITLEAIVVTKYKGETTYSILAGHRAGISLNPITGELVTVENGEPAASILVKASHTTTKGVVMSATNTITIAKRVYPSQATTTIQGNDTIEDLLTEYIFESSLPSITGDYSIDWVLGGNAVNDGHLSIEYSDNTKCVIRRDTIAHSDKPFYLQMTITKDLDGSELAVVTKDIVLPNYIAVDSESNPKLMAIIYAAGLSADANFLTIPEAESVLFSQVSNVFKGTDIDSFYELEYFTGLTKLPIECFKGCSNLTGLTIPKNITSFSTETFANCTLLETVAIPNKVTSIGEGCFRGCSTLNNIIIPPNITVLSDVTFFNCTQLSSITLPEGLTIIGINCFGNCNALLTVTLPSTITLLDEHCFSGCASLSSIRSNPAIAPIVKNNTFGINSDTYTGKSGNNNILLIPLDATGYNASFWLNPLCDPSKGKFTIQEAYTATEATSLTITANDVTADDTTTTINWIAYTKGTNDLTGGVITNIKQTGTAISAPFPQNDSEDNTVTRTITFTYLGKTATTTIVQAAYRAEVFPFEDAEAGIVLKAKNLIASPEGYTMRELGNITSLSSTFSNNKILTKFPELRYCTNVTNMNSTFSWCSNLTETPIIPANVTNMSSTFQVCSNLTEAPIIPAKVTDMSSTFYNCSKLTEAPAIPDSVTSMSGTFQGCSNLTEAPIIPAKVTDMISTFRNCTSLTEAPIIPANVTNMSYTFQGCPNLTEAPAIPDSVTSMSYTFDNCTSLTEAPIIPAKVTSMSYTFRNCTSINGIYIINPTTPPTYGSSLTNVVEIYVPDASVAAYKAASGWIAHADKIKPMSTKP